jgi:N-acyl-D-amino-acid deacylase
VIRCDTIIRDVRVLDGTGAAPQESDVAIAGDRIRRIGDLRDCSAQYVVEGKGRILSPGFIDTHAHDDLYVIRAPEMLPKLSQGVTTVIVGNCGISAAPVTPRGDYPSPMNLLGEAKAFQYPTFRDYVFSLAAVRPAVNVAALVGHTSLRNNHMDRLDRVATITEIAAMRAELSESLSHGALGLSTGLAYSSASAATSEEVMALAEALSPTGGIYATHIRTEGDLVLDAIAEALRIGGHANTPVVISHLKCAGVKNWKRSSEILRFLEANNGSSIGWDAYPYAASSTLLDLHQVDERITILVTWSAPHPEMSGKTLGEIADTWRMTQLDAATRLQPGGAIYHCIAEEDVRAILAHPRTMIGSDGLPNDAFPHPRLWGTFPRILGHYSRDLRLFPLPEAVRKMTSLPAQRFGLKDRGVVREGYIADLTLFNAETVRDKASFTEPVKPAVGIDAVWVNGVLSYRDEAATGERAGRFLSRESMMN